MSSFFIFSMARIAACECSGSESANNAGRITGVTCQETPMRSLSQLQ
jgi:hypothetical protein